MNIYLQVLTFSQKPQIWLFHVVVFFDDGNEMDKNEKAHVQSVQSYCFCLLNMQISDVLVAVAVVVAKAPFWVFASAHAPIKAIQSRSSTSLNH